MDGQTPSTIHAYLDGLEYRKLQHIAKENDIKASGTAVNLRKTLLNRFLTDYRPENNSKSRKSSSKDISFQSPRKSQQVSTHDESDDGSDLEVLGTNFNSQRRILKNAKLPAEFAQNLLSTPLMKDRKKSITVTTPTKPSATKSTQLLQTADTISISPRSRGRPSQAVLALQNTSTTITSNKVVKPNVYPTRRSRRIITMNDRHDSDEISDTNDIMESSDQDEIENTKNAKNQTISVHSQPHSRTGKKIDFITVQRKPKSKKTMPQIDTEPDSLENDQDSTNIDDNVEEMKKKSSKVATITQNTLSTLITKTRGRPKKSLSSAPVSNVPVSSSVSSSDSSKLASSSNQNNNQTPLINQIRRSTRRSTRWASMDKTPIFLDDNGQDDDHDQDDEYVQDDQNSQNSQDSQDNQAQYISSTPKATHLRQKNKHIKNTTRNVSSRGSTNVINTNHDSSDLFDSSESSEDDGIKLTQNQPNESDNESDNDNTDSLSMTSRRTTNPAPVHNDEDEDFSKFQSPQPKQTSSIPFSTKKRTHTASLRHNDDSTNTSTNSGNTKKNTRRMTIRGSTTTNTNDFPTTTLNPTHSTNSITSTAHSRKSLTTQNIDMNMNTMGTDDLFDSFPAGFTFDDSDDKTYQIHTNHQDNDADPCEIPFDSIELQNQLKNEKQQQEQQEQQHHELPQPPRSLFTPSSFPLQTSTSSQSIPITPTKTRSQLELSGHSPKRTQQIQSSHHQQQHQQFVSPSQTTGSPYRFTFPTHRTQPDGILTEILAANPHAISPPVHSSQLTPNHQITQDTHNTLNIAGLSKPMSSTIPLYSSPSKTISNQLAKYPIKSALKKQKSLANEVINDLYIAVARSPLKNNESENLNDVYSYSPSQSTTTSISRNNRPYTNDTQLEGPDFDDDVVLFDTSSGSFPLSTTQSTFNEAHSTRSDQISSFDTSHFDSESTSIGKINQNQHNSQIVHGNTHTDKSHNSTPLSPLYSELDNVVTIDDDDDQSTLHNNSNNNNDNNDTSDYNLNSSFNTTHTKNVGFTAENDVVIYATNAKDRRTSKEHHKLPRFLVAKKLDTSTANMNDVNMDDNDDEGDFSDFSVMSQTSSNGWESPTQYVHDSGFDDNLDDFSYTHEDVDIAVDDDVLQNDVDNFQDPTTLLNTTLNSSMVSSSRSRRGTSDVHLNHMPQYTSKHRHSLDSIAPSHGSSNRSSTQSNGVSKQHQPRRMTGLSFTSTASADSISIPDEFVPPTLTPKQKRRQSGVFKPNGEISQNGPSTASFDSFDRFDQNGQNGHQPSRPPTGLANFTNFGTDFSPVKSNKFDAALNDDDWNCDEFFISSLPSSKPPPSSNKQTSTSFPQDDILLAPSIKETSLSIPQSFDELSRSVVKPARRRTMFLSTDTNDDFDTLLDQTTQVIHDGKKTIPRDIENRENINFDHVDQIMLGLKIAQKNTTTSITPSRKQRGRSQIFTPIQHHMGMNNDDNDHDHDYANDNDNDDELYSTIAIDKLLAESKKQSTQSHLTTPNAMQDTESDLHFLQTTTIQPSSNISTNQRRKSSLHLPLLNKTITPTQTSTSTSTSTSALAAPLVASPRFQAHKRKSMISNEETTKLIDQIDTELDSLYRQQQEVANNTPKKNQFQQFLPTKSPIRPSLPFNTNVLDSDDEAALDAQPIVKKRRLSLQNSQSFSPHQDPLKHYTPTQTTNITPTSSQIDNDSLVQLSPPLSFHSPQFNKKNLQKESLFTPKKNQNGYIDEDHQKTPINTPINGKTKSSQFSKKNSPKNLSQRSPHRVQIQSTPQNIQKSPHRQTIQSATLNPPKHPHRTPVQIPSTLPKSPHRQTLASVQSKINTQPLLSTPSRKTLNNIPAKPTSTPTKATITTPNRTIQTRPAMAMTPLAQSPARALASKSSGFSGKPPSLSIIPKTTTNNTNNVSINKPKITPSSASASYIAKLGSNSQGSISNSTPNMGSIQKPKFTSTATKPSSATAATPKLTTATPRPTTINSGVSIFNRVVASKNNKKPQSNPQTK